MPRVHVCFMLQPFTFPLFPSFYTTSKLISQFMILVTTGKKECEKGVVENKCATSDKYMESIHVTDPT